MGLHQDVPNTTLYESLLQPHGNGESLYLWALISIAGEWETCGGDEAYEELLYFSAVDNLDRAIKASGKLGGVHGVLAGAHSWKYKNPMFKISSKANVNSIIN